MAKLPRRLQPAWGHFKRLHRLLTLLVGMLTRTLSPALGSRGVPVRATDRSVDTAAQEPATVTVHAGGPAETLIRPRPVGHDSGHWVMARHAEAHVPARYVLDVRGGRISGDFGALTTPGKLLDYQTSGYFGIDSWREHPLFLRPTLGRREPISGTVLSLTARGTSNNYYHFLYDALARLGVLEECLPDVQVDAVLVPHATGYQRQLLELAGVRGPLIQPRAGVTVHADRLLVPSTPNQDLQAPPFLVDWLRDRLPPTRTRDTPRRLFLTRGTVPHTRIYVEQEQVRPWLEQHGFVILDPGSLSVQEQIDHFANAEIVVAPHGAALTNITFCGPGTRVLELFAPSYVHLGLRNIAAAVDGIEYSYLVGAGHHPVGSPMLGVYDDVSIPPAEVQEAIRGLLRP